MIDPDEEARAAKERIDGRPQPTYAEVAAELGRDWAAELEATKAEIILASVAAPDLEACEACDAIHPVGECV